MLTRVVLVVFVSAGLALGLALGAFLDSLGRVGL
jgi:hypothetical protein